MRIDLFEQDAAWVLQVADNGVGVPPDVASGSASLGLLGMTERAESILRSVALFERRDTPVASLPHGDQRKLEVALLIALDPKVFMFDEPTAGMSVDEVPVILDLIKRILFRRDFLRRNKLEVDKHIRSFHRGLREYMRKESSPEADQAVRTSWSEIERMTALQAKDAKAA